VGACVGARGARVKTIVRELNGEKIDIINYFADPKQMIIEALKPAVPREILLDEKNHRILLKVDTENLAIAIGRKGQNARLTSRLIGWRIDIEEYRAVSSDPREAAILSLVKVLEVDRPVVERLVAIGMNSLSVLETVEASDLTDAGFTEEEAQKIMARVTK